MNGTPSMTIGQCEVVEGLFVGSLNVRGGYRLRKDELLDLAEGLDVPILALSDVRAKGQSEEQLSGYKVFLSWVCVS